MPKGLVGLILLVALPLGVWAINYWLTFPLQIAWLLTIAVLAGFLLVLGLVAKENPLFVFIDERNKYSLSRLQIVVWTVVVLSAFGSLALARLRVGGIADPLAIVVPDELWLAIGITATALVGSPLVRSVKAQSTNVPDPQETRRTLGRVMGKSDAKTLDEAVATRTQGLIVVNPDPKDARWTDLFEGEETGNAASFDIGKIQMFYFTVLVVFAYSVAIFGSFASTAINDLGQLPGFTPALVTLLALANGTYLANKVVPHSQKE